MSPWASDKVIRHASKDTDVQSVTGARIGGVRNISWIFSLSFSLSLYLSLQKCSTQLPEKRQCDQMDSNGTKEQAYPPSCPTPLIPWPPLAGEVDEGIGQASMLAGRPTHLFDNPVSGTIVLAFDARCVKYHRIIYNYTYIYIYTIHTYSTILYYSISK